MGWCWLISTQWREFMYELTTDKKLLKELENCRNKAKGYTYIMSNPAHVGWFKVGNTNDPKTRLSVANRWSPKKDYKIEHQVFTKDKKRLEKVMHQSLRHYGVEYSDEWFQFDCEKLINLCNKLAEYETTWNEYDTFSFVLPQSIKYKIYKPNLEDAIERLEKFTNKLDQGDT